MKKFLIALAALTSMSINAGENQSLHEFMVKNYDWKQDSSHIVHVGTRCSAVMDAAVWRLSADNRSEVKSLADQYKSASNVYLFSTTPLAQKINYSTDGYIKLYKWWMDTYKLMAEENAIKYNDFSYGMLGEDFMICGDKQNFSFYKSMLENSVRK
jgi:hypothetical protein